MLIQWHSEPHPATSLPDCGCALVGLEGFHPQAPDVSRMLANIGFQGPFQLAQNTGGEPPRLIARIQTAAGLRSLSSLGVSRG